MRAALAATMIWAAVLILAAAVVMGGCARREATYWGSIAAEVGRR